jgi:hypothetical protein
MEFASEMVIKAQLSGFRLTVVPTVLRPDGRDRAPHLRSFRDGWRHLRFMLLFSPRWLFFVPGCVLLSAGLMLMLLIAWNSPMRVAGISLSVNTSVAASLLVLLGSQLIGTGIFARRLATRIGLLPPSVKLNRWTSHVSLEQGVLAGVTTAVMGFVLLVYAVILWSGTGFAKLDPALTTRFVVPAMTLVVLGTGLSFISFLFGLIHLKVGTHAQYETQSDSDGSSR